MKFIMTAEIQLDEEGIENLTDEEFEQIEYDMIDGLSSTDACESVRETINEYYASWRVVEVSLDALAGEGDYAHVVIKEKDLTSLKRRLRAAQKELRELKGDIEDKP